MHLPWYIPFTKIFFMSIANYYVATKMTNKKMNNNMLVLLLCVNDGIIYTLLRNTTDILIAYPIYYLIFTVIYSYFSKTNIQRGLVISLITNAVAITSMFLATLCSFITMKSCKIQLRNYNIIEYILIGIFQILFIYLFFRIKRFKDGFAFLNNTKLNKEISSIIISVIILTISIILGLQYNALIESALIIGIIIGGILMFYWIKKSITKYYKEKMKERTVEIQQEQIKEKDETIKNLKTELATVLQINHKYSQRISAMEKAVSKLAPTLQTNEEYAEEYGDILSYINELSKEYKEEVALTIKENKLPKTNVFSIDNLLEYMKQEAEKEKIDFDLELKFNINEIIENKIAKNKLETILTDHIRDAIIAIKSSENKNRKIKVILNKDENYQIEFYDTGIEFEIDTLLKLGLERTTTHKATGGTGIGFVTTFETLKECKASLIIEEFNNKQYTKAIIIKFDNKNEYKIHSYRAEEIKNKTKNNRIKIYKIN